MLWRKADKAFHYCSRCVRLDLCQPFYDDAAANATIQAVCLEEAQHAPNLTLDLRHGLPLNSLEANHKGSLNSSRCKKPYWDLSVMRITTSFTRSSRGCVVTQFPGEERVDA